MGDNAGAAVTNDAHKHLDGRDIVLAGDLFQCLELKFRMRTAARNSDVRGSAHVCQTRATSTGSSVAATGNQHANRRTPRFVGITIGGDILAPLPRSFDQADGIARTTPHANRAKLDMRHLSGQTRLTTDTNKFVERFESLVRFVPYVADVDALGTAGDRG